MTKNPTRLRPTHGGMMRTVTPKFAPGLALGKNGGAFATSSDRGEPPADSDRLRHERCDCGDPQCELPRGRCFICKAPIINDRVYAVCSSCDIEHNVRSCWQDLYEACETTTKTQSERECFCPGWLWMNEDDDASFNIERCDCCDLLVDDTDAAASMAASCRISRIEWP